MKKRFFPLFILILTFGLVSCSNQLRTKANVTMSLDVQQVYKSIAAREGEGDESTKIFPGEDGNMTFDVKLFVDNKEFDSQSEVLTEKRADELGEGTVTITFKDVPYYSTVYAEAWINYTDNEKDITYTFLYGKSEEKVLDSPSMELAVNFEYTEDFKRVMEGGDDGSDKTPKPQRMFTIEYQMWKKKDSGTNPVQTDEYELAETFIYSIDFNNYMSNPNAVSETDISVQAAEYQMFMDLEGYTVNDTLSDHDPEVYLDQMRIVYSVYFDKTKTAITPVVMNGTDTKNNSYILKLYPADTDGGSNYFVVTDSENKKASFGMFMAIQSGNDYTFSYIQMFGYNDKIPVMVYSATSQSIPDFDNAQYSVANPAPFTLNCKTDNNGNSFPVTFNYPAGFNIFAFVPYNGDDIPVMGNIILPGIPNISITKLDSTTPLTLNAGEQLFKITALNENTSITGMSVKLYHNGNEVPASEYLVQTVSSEILMVSPKFLSNGGSYIAKVIVNGIYYGKAFEACSSYILQVENQVIATLDVSQDTFMQSLIEVMSKASGPVKLTLTGERNFNPTNYYSPDYSLYQNIGYVLHQYNNPVELDMSGVSGNGTRVLETEIFSGLNSKITLATNLKAIHCAADTIFDLSQAGSSISSGTWYRLEVDKSWDDTMPGILTIKEVLAGNKTINEVYDNLMDINNQYSNFNFSLSNWTEVVDTLSGNAQTYDSRTYYFFKGEN